MCKQRLTLQTIRNEAIAQIQMVMTRHRDETADFTAVGATPVIMKDDLDDNNTFTLDRITLEDCGTGEHLLFESLSCSDNRTDTETSIPTDTLINILDFLRDNEDSIWDPDIHKEKSLDRIQTDLDEECNESDAVTEEVLAQIPVSRFKEYNLSIEDIFLLYCRVMNARKGDVFLRRNDNEGWQVDVLTGNRTEKTKQ